MQCPPFPVKSIRRPAVKRNLCHQYQSSEFIFHVHPPSHPPTPLLKFLKQMLKKNICVTSACFNLIFDKVVLMMLRMEKPMTKMMKMMMKMMKMMMVTKTCLLFDGIISDRSNQAEKVGSQNQPSLQPGYESVPSS